VNDISTMRVDMFLWLLFSDGRQDDYQLVSRLRLLPEFVVLFQHGTPDMVVQMC